MASMLDRCTIIRSVDARYSNHEPNRVFQSGHLDAEPRLDPGPYVSGIGSVIAKYEWCRPLGPLLRGLSDLEATSRMGVISADNTTPSSPTEPPRLPILTDVGVDTGLETHDLSYHTPPRGHGTTTETTSSLRRNQQGLRPLLPLSTTSSQRWWPISTNEAYSTTSW